MMQVKNQTSDIQEPISISCPRLTWLSSKQPNSTETGKFSIGSYPMTTRLFLIKTLHNVSFTETLPAVNCHVCFFLKEHTWPFFLTPTPGSWTPTEIHDTTTRVFIKLAVWRLNVFQQPGRALDKPSTAVLIHFDGSNVFTATTVSF